MKCFHCRLDFDEKSMIFQGEKVFCCNGCKNVYNLINENNLEEFYKNATNLSKVDEKISYDEHSFFIQKEENYEKILILIDNLHCIACVWLIEKMLLKNEGVLEIDINYHTKRASIEYNPLITNAKDILNTIISLGYTPLAFNPSTTTKAKKTHIEFYSRLIVAIACVMNIMWLSIARYAGYFSSMEQSIQDIINFAEFVLCTPVLFYSASSMFKSAYLALKNKILNMDCLVTTGASLVYVYSIIAMFKRLPYVYFDSVAMIICFVFIGRFLEQLARKQALENIDFLSDLLNASVNVIKGENIEKISVTNIKKDDVLRVFLGDKILIDGYALNDAKLNLSAITGESELVNIKKGDFIKSASVVECASFDYIASCTFNDSYINKLANLLNKTKKSNLERLTDKIGVYFCYAIFSIAFLCFLYNISNINEAIIRSVSLLIIACPCALALSAPVGNILCIHEALKLKVLFKNASFIENLSKINMAVFDKTGVLSKSKLELLSSINLNDNDKSILKAILNKNNHIIASSLNEYLKDIKPSEKDFNLIQLNGLGVLAEFENGIRYIFGSAKLLKQYNINAISKNETEVFFAKNDEILEHFIFSNVISDDALNLINYLKSSNIKVVMLSGDKQKPCEKIANELGISEYYYECLPEDKLKTIENFSKNNKVLMVGDGINDALALKLALVGISFKNASNLALNSSDIVMLDNKLIGIKNSHLLATKTYKLIKTNLALSFLYNIISIPLAFNGLINPLIASIFMSLSSICVIINSTRIKSYAKKIKNLK